MIIKKEKKELEETKLFKIKNFFIYLSFIAIGLF